MAISNPFANKFFQGMLTVLGPILAATVLTITTPIKDKIISYFIKEDILIIMDTGVVSCYEGDQFPLFISLQSKNLLGSQYPGGVAPN